ncbi:MAG TPA: aminotransferase class V-fold PLP-dependent enzyme [Cyclobacteriaceae bacterium]|nr:aminotransferase class V-fold PLP-dependent enzyme [Cyclobacteriaceae bacterium]
MNKRTFLKSLGLLGLGPSPAYASLEQLLDSANHISATRLAEDEKFWQEVRKGYRLKPDYINLENGYYCIQPQAVLDRFTEHVREINYQGSYYMRTVQFENKKATAARLASLLGCPPDELVITRNTTESLDMIISGFPWKEGDEAVMAEQDYGAMLDMFKQVAKRYGVVNRIISVPNHPASDEEIVNLYASTITPKTKLLMICHMINITGQILPVRKICDMAHSKGVEVMVDGAHAFAHIKFSLPDLNCDYYGSSLHKWLSVPLGAGVLCVKKQHIPKIWPLFADAISKDDEVMRLNHTGTHPVHTDLSINDAIDYYSKIGIERKEARLRFLQNYWTRQVRKWPHIILNTPEDPSRSCGIANVGVKNLRPADLADTLLKRFKIYTVAIDGANVQGCRITPNIFTSLRELDVFVDALRQLG